MDKKGVCRYYDSRMVGWLELCVSDRGVRSISFVATASESPSSSGHPVMDQLVEELNQYFGHRLKNFSVPLDPLSGTPFQRSVWEALVQIPYGQTRSYADIATVIGKPRATRAVGSANGKNPIPIVVPCHRVIRANGDLGGYSSGTTIKRMLLNWEGVPVVTP